MRLDKHLFYNGYFKSRTKAAESVLRGEVYVNGIMADKPSTELSEGDKIEIKSTALNFASNGGYKLEKAFNDFALSVKGLECADVGASTGGFTDCLLRHGAKKVYAIDVGESLLAEELKNDERVVVIDNYNARELKTEDFARPIDFVSVDVSFISLTYVLKPIYDILSDDGTAVSLLKPQFEAGRKSLNKNGIVTDVSARIAAARKVYDFAENIGFSVTDFTSAPEKSDKNREYLFLFKKRKEKSIDFIKLSDIIKNKGQI